MRDTRAQQGHWSDRAAMNVWSECEVVLPPPVRVKSMRIRRTVHGVRKAFVQACDGSNRWFFTMMCLGCAAVVAYFIVTGAPLEVWHPIHLKGPVVLWIMVIGTVLLGLHAAFSWFSWTRDSRHDQNITRQVTLDLVTESPSGD